MELNSCPFCENPQKNELKQREDGKDENGTQKRKFRKIKR